LSDFNSLSVNQVRHHEVDWLRIFVVLSLVPVHGAMVFVEPFFFVKNAEKSEWLWNFVVFMSAWRMPLLFLVSGFGTWYALRKRTVREYIRERAARLLIPLLFGIFFIIPPQIWVEKNYQIPLDQRVTFWEFLKSAWVGIYPKGNLSYHHLWFLLYLFLFSLLLLPLFLWVKSKKESGNTNQRMIPWNLGILFLWFFELILRPISGSLPVLVGDWANLFQYSYLFFLGFILAQNRQYLDGLVRQWHLNFVVLSILVAVNFNVGWRHFPAPGYSPEYLSYIFVRSSITWFGISTAIGFFGHYAKKFHPSLELLKLGVFPFYILHQTVLVVAAYGLIRLQWSLPVKFITLCLGTYLVCALMIRYIILPLPFLHVFFGIKNPSPKQNDLKPQVSMCSPS